MKRLRPITSRLSDLRQKYDFHPSEDDAIRTATVVIDQISRMLESQPKVSARERKIIDILMSVDMIVPGVVDG